MDYKEAGVDIDAGNRAVALIRDLAAGTSRPEVLAGVGGFAGLFALDLARYREPVLVAGCDGVGTKLKVAQMTGKHDTIGIDLVAMSVNDILVCGAEPLFFLDYFACGKLDPGQVAEVVKGIAAGCREAGCALIGGETAELPGFYAPGEYDLAGFAVGVVERDAVWNGKGIEAGDVLLGLPSSGLHSNGYSLVRRLFFEVLGYGPGTYLPELGRTLGEELLVPTRIYARAVRLLRARYPCPGPVKAAAHITGGGLVENIPRVLPPGLGARLRWGAWPVPPVFGLLAARVPEAEMRRVFNLGLGFVLVVAREEAEDVRSYLAARGEESYLVGEVVRGEGVVFD